MILTILLGFSPAFSAEQAPLRVAYPDFWPFFTRDNTGEMTGFFYEIVNTALTGYMKVDVQWDNYPWRRCQARVQEGDSDAMITVPTKERLEYAKSHADPFYNKSLTIFTYADHPRLDAIRKIRSLDDIKNEKLTVITYSGNGWCQENVCSRGIPVEQTGELKNVWRMLAHKRGDIVIEWPGSAWPDINSLGLQKNIVQTKVALNAMPFHLLIRNGSPYADKLTEFNATIREMHKDGTIERILSRYQGAGNSIGE